MHARQQKSQKWQRLKAKYQCLKCAMYDQHITATANIPLIFDPTPFFTFSAPNDGTCTNRGDISAGALDVHAFGAKASPDDILRHRP